MVSGESYCVSLLHQRRPDIERGYLCEYFGDEYAELLKGLRPKLGYQHYFQQHASTDIGLGEVIGVGRSWLPIAAAALATGHAAPLPDVDCDDCGQAFDAGDTFYYESRAALLDHLEGRACRDALAVVSDARRPWIGRTLAIVGPAYQVAEARAMCPRVKLTFCLVRKPEMNRQAMQRYWRHEHGPFVRTLEQKLRYAGYCQVHAESRGPVQLPAQAFGAEEATGYDGTASLVYPSESALREIFSTLACQQANMALTRDELNFVDAQRSQLFYGTEISIV